MENYIAFIRAINVGGRNKITTGEQKEIFQLIGNNVHTYLHTGNVIFSSELEIDKIMAIVQPVLDDKIGNRVEIIVLPLKDLVDLVNCNPFDDDNLDHYVIITSSATMLDIPMVFDGRQTKNMGELTIFRQSSNLILATFRRIEGKRGFSPNTIVEKITSGPATTRKWNTIIKMLGKFT